MYFLAPLYLITLMWVSMWSHHVFIVCTGPAEGLIRRHMSLCFHGLMRPSTFSSIHGKYLSQCLIKIGIQIRASCLRRNPEETEVMLVGWVEQSEDMRRTMSAP